MITRLSHGHPFLRSAIVLALLAQCTYPGIAQEDSDPSIENVWFVVFNDQVELHFDLIGDPAEPMDIQLLLKRESDSTFQYIPLAVTGDIDTSVAPATDRRIIWDYRAEFPEGLIGNDYFFVVEARPVPASGVPVTTKWIIGGAVALGACVGIGLLLGQEKGTEPPGSSTFPTPPGRP